jgi:hypothetical protein
VPASRASPSTWTRLDPPARAALKGAAPRHVPEARAFALRAWSYAEPCARSSRWTVSIAALAVSPAARRFALAPPAFARVQVRASSSNATVFASTSGAIRPTVASAGSYVEAHSLVSAERALPTPWVRKYLSRCPCVPTPTASVAHEKQRTALVTRSLRAHFGSGGARRCARARGSAER